MSNSLITEACHGCGETGMPFDLFEFKHNGRFIRTLFLCESCSDAMTVFFRNVAAPRIARLIAGYADKEVSA